MPRKAESMGAVPWLRFVAVVFFLAIGYLCYRFQRMPGSDQASSYLSELTLVVTIVAAFAALISLGGVYLMNRAIGEADQIRRRTEEYDRSLVEQREKWKQKIAEVETSWSESNRAIGETRAIADSHLASLRNSAAASIHQGSSLPGRFRPQNKLLTKRSCLMRRAKRAAFSSTGSPEQC